MASDLRAVEDCNELEELADLYDLDVAPPSGAAKDRNHWVVSQ
ncbi:hypothetical protein ACWDU8_13000 [Streptomyces sp. NPDC003388]